MAAPPLSISYDVPSTANPHNTTENRGDLHMLSFATAKPLLRTMLPSLDFADSPAGDSTSLSYVALASVSWSLFYTTDPAVRDP